MKPRDAFDSLKVTVYLIIAVALVSVWAAVAHVIVTIIGVLP